jgi:hypothetical protein
MANRTEVFDSGIDPKLRPGETIPKTRWCKPPTAWPKPLPDGWSAATRYPPFQIEARANFRKDLSERQHPGARLVRPVEGDDGALAEFRFAISKGAEKRGTAYFWYERLPTEEHNTGSIALRVRENLREIQIVRQNDVCASAGVVADFHDP